MSQSLHKVRRCGEAGAGEQDVSTLPAGNSSLAGDGKERKQPKK